MSEVDASEVDAAVPLRWNREAKHWEDIEQGEFFYRRDASGRVKWVYFWPRDCRFPLSAAIAPQSNGSGASWTLSGTDEAPTLTPSVDARGVGWHGFLTNGVARRA